MSQTDEQLLGKWYAVVNDLIGGWCVATRDVPASQLQPGEELMDTGSEAIAKYVVAMHNAHAQV